MSKWIKVLGTLGVGGQKGLVYEPSGLCPCICATTYKDPIKVTIKNKRTRNITINLKDGIIYTFKSNYYKTSLSNLLNESSGRRACGVLVVPDDGTKYVDNVNWDVLRQHDETL